MWAPDYATTAELRDYLRINDETDDVQLGIAITSASRAVDQMTGRQFGQVAVAERRVYRAARDLRARRWVVEVDDTMVAPTLVATDPAGTETFTGTTIDYVLRDINAAALGEPWTRLELTRAATVSPHLPDGFVAVTALWGWSAVPSTVEQATLIQAARVFKRRVAPFGVAGPTSDQAPGLRLLAKIDPDVEVMLKPYLRRWFFR